MWVGLILLCNMATNECLSLSGPVVRNELQCELTIANAIGPVSIQYPDHAIVGFQCVSWGTPA